MSGTPLKLAVIGGLGLMASPMAKHWAKGGSIQVLRVHDRGTPGERRDRARRAWQVHGASLVSSLEALAGSDIDGVIVCCGKNGDDIPIIGQLAKLLDKGKFICHLSTVSTRFVQAAHEYCSQQDIRYVNYPLTGGPLGAEQGKLLILASGERQLFDYLEPAFKYLGTPKYFGESITAGAEVKFIGHIMVFNGLIGICSAAAIHAECFTDGKIGGQQQSDFFDFLNAGAGGTRQWDVILSAGIKNDIWNAPFLLRYGAVDALYTVDLCLQKRTSFLTAEPVLNAALAFSYVINEINPDFATHVIVRELVTNRAKAFDAFMLRHAGSRGDIEKSLTQCIASLPPPIQQCAALDVLPSHFAA